jgi:hypothetical protein
MGWDTNKWVNCITLWSGICFEKPVFIQRSRLVPVFYGILRFITWSTWASHWILFWTTLFQFTTSHLVFYVHFNVASSTLGLGSGLFLFSFLTDILIWFPWNVRCRLQIVKLLITQLSWASCYFLSLRSIYCPLHPTGRHPHWHITTKWLLPFVYRQHIGPVFVKCRFPIEELDILPLKLWPLCCLLTLDIYHHVMWCAISQKNEVLKWTAAEAK